ncbi:MAG: hypothetical protein IKU22_03800 [Alistipes sp.]|nr:hypothetical protein [Alistipes sp.]
MANKKQNSQYTIVYVFGPTRCKDAYLDDEILDRAKGEFVKIGKADFNGNLAECTEESVKKAAVSRCSQESRTGIPDWCDIYDTFIFPQKDGQDVDNIIRNLLCNDVYSLDNSRDESREMKGDIKPGKEFVYGVSRNHIKHAVESYCFQLIVNAESDKLNEIQTICKYNANISDTKEDEVEDEKKDIKTRKNRDINMILSIGDIVYLTNWRNKGKAVCIDGKQIQAEYIGNKKFKYDEKEPMFASKLALELINKYGLPEGTEPYQTISGNDCWQIDENNHKISLAEYYDRQIGSE